MALYRIPDNLPKWLPLRSPTEDVRLRVPLRVVVVEEGYIDWIVRDWRRVDAPPFDEVESAVLRLSEFVGLEDANDRTIQRFAERFGILGFCEHGQPGAHQDCFPALQITTEKIRAHPVLVFRDKTEDWRKLARGMRAILEVAQNVQDGEKPKRSLWHTVFSESSPDLVDFLLSQPDQEGLLSTALAQLAAAAGLRPFVQYRGSSEGFHLTLWRDVDADHDPFSDQWFPWTEHSLFYLLVTQLVLAVAGNQLLPCSQCGRSFDWETQYPRSPRHDRGAYCTPTCRKEAHRRQRAAYKRKVKQREKGEQKDGH